MLIDMLVLEVNSINNSCCYCYDFDSNCKCVHEHNILGEFEGNIYQMNHWSKKSTTTPPVSENTIFKTQLKHWELLYEF